MPTVGSFYPLGKIFQNDRLLMKSQIDSETIIPTLHTARECHDAAVTDQPQTVLMHTTRTLLATLLLFPLLAFSKDFKGAELRTKASFTYGRFEVRLKSAAREGVLSSFFTYHDGGSGWNEIDIEILGRYERDVQFNAITPGQSHHVRHQPVAFNPHLDFHTYAIEWTPSYVAWFIDEVEVYRQTEAHVATLNQPQKIMMNIWNPVYANWAGAWNAEVLPAFAYYDWVSYSTYTPGSGTRGTDKNFTLQWRDDFNTWDQTRWAKATHTFDGNQCDFVPENAVFQNGMMILGLTQPGNLGFNDRSAPAVKWARLTGNEITVHFSEEVEKASAETPTNYVLAGASVTSAMLQEDLKTVALTVANVDVNANYVLIVREVTDRATTPNKVALRGVNVIKAKPLSLPMKINVGGSALRDYLPDQEWRENAEYGFLDGGVTQWSSNQPIANTEDDELYRSERWGLVLYRVRVPQGKYRITLLFAENYFNAANQRSFDVTVEGKRTVTALDLYREVGAHAAYVRVAEEVEVHDGILDIHFAALKDQALLNGLLVEAAPTAVRENLAPPEQFNLLQNFPNPFRDHTVIHFTVAAPERIRLQIFDMLGALVEQHELGMKAAGRHEFAWPARTTREAPLSGGVYFYRLVGSRTNFPMQKFLLIK